MADLAINTLREQNAALHHELRVARNEAATYREAVEALDKKRSELEEQIKQLKAELQFKSPPIVHHHYHYSPAPLPTPKYWTTASGGTGSPPL